MQEKVYQEIMNVLEPNQFPSMKQLNDLQLMERCLKESMRLFAPAPVIMRVNTGGDLKICEYSYDKAYT